MGVKILFCFYPLYVKYNHGIALLSALCKKRGIETDVYILDDVKRFGEYISMSETPYVGFSCVTIHDYKISFPYMEEAMRQGKIVLLGGVYCRGKGRVIEAPAHYVCRGEGETLPDFLLDGDDRLFRENLLCEDLNKLPLPDMSGMLFDKKIPLITTQKVYPYHTSRGCPHQCSFCEVRGQTGKVRVRHRVKEDINNLIDKHDIDILYITDEMLPYNSKQWRDSWGDFSFPFIGYIRADITEERLCWLKDRGMTGTVFGVESGDEKYRNEKLKKDLTDEEIFNTVKLLKKLGIYYMASFMTNTPEETFKIKAKTYRMAQDIGGVMQYIAPYENLFAQVEEAIWQ